MSPEVKFAPGFELPMLLRVLTGRVLEGREDAFIDQVRRHVADNLRSTSGLLSLMLGYRRVAGLDEFVMATGWQSEADLRQALGDDPVGNPVTKRILDDVAQIERIDHYTLIPPMQAGVLDAPGAVLRLGHAIVRPGRLAELHRYIAEKDRQLNIVRSLLGLCIGERTENGRQRIVGISAWASPVMIEALAEPGREGKSLFAAADEYVSESTVEHYQAIELELPNKLRDLGGRRLIAARFDSEQSASLARAGIAARVPSANEAGVSVARLAHSLGGGEQHHVLVARVTLVDHLRAERLIADLGGQVLYEADVVT